MKLNSLLSAVALAFFLTACSGVEKIVYRIDVPQGNYLDANTVAQVKPGMNARQVQYLLGTPMLIDPYSQTTWYYVYLQQKAYQTPEQYTFVVHFDQRGTVSEVKLDKPLPPAEAVNHNNTIIHATDNGPKRWWQFWK